MGVQSDYQTLKKRFFMAEIISIEDYRNLIRPRISKKGWRTVEGRSIFFRSKWEANYGRYLSYLKANSHIRNWFHEPKTFWFEAIKRGTRSYLPDFQIIENNGTTYWVEVKGYMDSKSHTKIKRFRKYYSEEKLILIQGPWFKENNPKMRLLINDWE